MKPHVLVVEDEPSIAEPLGETLAREGFEVSIAGDLAQARVSLATSPDLVLLDVMLPDGDGRDLCREIRRDSDVPIIMLTARGDEVDKVVALELGADDYVVKPFSARELVARMRAIMRRGRNGQSDHKAMTVQELTLDPAARTVVLADAPLELTPREFDLLELLMRHAGEVVRREDIMDEVWDPHWFGPTKTLDVHISWLRKKLHDDPNAPRYIATVRGVGFRFIDDDR